MRKDSALLHFYYSKLPKAQGGQQTGDPNKPYSKTNPQGYVSMKNNQDWFDSHANWTSTGDPKYDAKVRQQIMTGRFGLDPNSGALIKLPQNEWSNISNENKRLATDKRQWTPAQKQTGWENQVKPQIVQSTKDLITNPVMMAPGAILTGGMLAGLPAVANTAAATATALGTDIGGIAGLTGSNLINAGFAYQGAKNLPNVYNAWGQVGNKPTWGNIGNAAGETATTALDMFPFLHGASKGIPSFMQDLKQTEILNKLFGKTDPYKAIAQNLQAGNLSTGAPAQSFDLDELRRVYHNNERFLQREEAQYLHKHGHGLPENYVNARRRMSDLIPGARGYAPQTTNQMPRPLSELYLDVNAPSSGIGGLPIPADMPRPPADPWDMDTFRSTFSGNTGIMSKPRPSWETYRNTLPPDLTFEETNSAYQGWQNYQPTPSTIWSTPTKSVNRSGLTVEEALAKASEKDKEVISKMTDDEFKSTVLKPTGEIVPYQNALGIADKMAYNNATREIQATGSQPLTSEAYADLFNSRLDLLNQTIAKNNKSGVDFSVTGLTPSGRLKFNGPTGESTWGVGINPGQWRGEVEDIANTDYFKSIPGLDMQNTTNSVFGDYNPRRGTGAYESINDYLKQLDLGRVKAGFNSQTASSRPLWENAVKKGKAFGFYNNPNTVHGIMKSLLPIVGAGTVATSLSEEKYGGLLNRTVTCSNCGHSWKGVDGAKDPLTCHNCGGQIKMQQGGISQYGPGGQTTDGCPANFHMTSFGCMPNTALDFTANQTQQAQLKSSNKPIVKDANYGKKMDPYVGTETVKNGLVDNVANYVYNNANPFNWGLTDYSKSGSFNNAYSDAVKNNKKEFMYNSKRYTTDYKGTKQEQLAARGVTNDQRMNQNVFRKALRNIDQGSAEEGIDEGYNGYPNPFNAIGDLLAGKKYNTEDDPEQTDMLNMYAGAPQINNTLGISNYKPSKVKLNNTSTYYKVNPLNNLMPNQLTQKQFDYVNENKTFNPDFSGFGSWVDDKGVPHNNYRGLGTFTLDAGKDDRGDYVSYYDKWDLNPFSSGKDAPDLSMGAGKPYEIYDRIYYKDYGKGVKNRMYYSDDELGKLDMNSKNFDTKALQRELANRGYNLNKSAKRYSSGEIKDYDGIMGEETKNAYLDWKSKYSTPKKGYGGLTQYDEGGEPCLPGFFKNAFGHCVNASGQTPDQANASKSTMINLASPPVVTAPPVVAKKSIATPYKTRTQEVQQSLANTAKPSQQDETYRLLIAAGMDPKSAKIQSRPGVNMLDTTKKMLEAQQQKEYRTKMSGGYDASKSTESQYGLADNNSLDARVERGRNMVMGQDLGLGSGVNTIKDILFSPGSSAVNASHPYDSYVKPGWKQGTMNAVGDALNLFPELPIKGAQALHYGVTGIPTATKQLGSKIISKVDQAVYPTRAYRSEVPGGNASVYASSASGETADLAAKVNKKGEWATDNLQDAFHYAKGFESDALAGNKPGLLTGQDINFTEYKLPFWKKNISFDTDVTALKNSQGAAINSSEYIIPSKTKLDKILYPRRTTTIKAVPDEIKLNDRFYTKGSVAPINSTQYASKPYQYIQDQINAVTGHEMPITYDFDPTKRFQSNPIKNWTQPSIAPNSGVGNFNFNGSGTSSQPSRFFSKVNTFMNPPVPEHLGEAVFNTKQLGSYNTETGARDMYSVNLPDRLVPGRSFEDVSHKMGNLKKDLGINKVQDFLYKRFPKLSNEIPLDQGKGMLFDPETGKLFDSNTRYWLNRQYGHTPSIEGLIGERESSIAKNYGKYLFSEEPTKLNWLQTPKKRYGGDISIPALTTKMPALSLGGSIGMKPKESPLLNYYLQRTGGKRMIR